MKWARIPSIVLAAAVSFNCAGPSESGGPPGFAQVTVRSVAPPSLSRFAPALVLSRVVIGVDRVSQDESSERLATRRAPFDETTNQISVDLSVPVNGEEVLWVNLSYQTVDSVELFVSNFPVTVAPGRQATTAAAEPFYVGPGANIAFMSMNGDDTTVSAGAAVQLDVTAFDSAQAEVTDFYLTWSTDDPRVTVSPRGLVQTRANATQQVRVFARTPNGTETSTLMFVQGDAPIAIAPDSVELRPGQAQQFDITISPDIGINWSVNGVVGGDSAHGLIDFNGLYTAPPTSPPGGEVTVCAEDTNDPTVKGCARVLVPAVPTAGADVVVINDLNLFDSTMMVGAGNKRFVRNLVNDVGAGPRSAGHVVWSDRGRQSGCVPPIDTFNECGDAAKKQFFDEIRRAGHTITSFDAAPANLLQIPSNVRAIIFWMPYLAFSIDEVNGLKRFAADGGRIIFIGENNLYYTAAGIQVENALLADLGSQMVNRGDLIDCVDETGLPLFYTTPAASMRQHTLTTGVANLRYLCGSEVQTGVGDFPLFYDITNTFALAGVAKISLEPIILTSRARVQSSPAGGAAPPSRNSRGVLR